MNINFTDTKFSFLENHPDLSKIKWIFCSKDKYLKFEEMFKLNAIFFDSFLIDSFFDKNEFDELKNVPINTLKKNLPLMIDLSNDKIGGYIVKELSFNNFS